MDLKLFIGIIFGISLVFGVSLAVPLVSSAQPPTPPPTPAWDQILFRYDNWTVTNDDNINASSYTDNLYLISDGSILFNVTTYP